MGAACTWMWRRKTRRCSSRRAGRHLGPMTCSSLRRTTPGTSPLSCRKYRSTSPVNIPRWSWMRAGRIPRPRSNVISPNMCRTTGLPSRAWAARNWWTPSIRRWRSSPSWPDMCSGPASRRSTSTAGRTSRSSMQAGRRRSWKSGLKAPSMPSTWCAGCCIPPAWCWTTQALQYWGI